MRRKHWGKGVGSGLMKEAIKLAKELGCRKLMLGTIEGNERAIKLYKKFGFQVETCEDEEIYIDGSWRTNYIMGLDLASCEPKLPPSSSESFVSETKFSEDPTTKIVVRQLVNSDIDEVHRLQNCPESTKSCNKIPQITKEETKRWYEELKSMEGTYCVACFEDNKLLGYLQFRAERLPSPSLKFEEMIVDVNQKPEATADALAKASKKFRERYAYRKIFAHTPETSLPIINAFRRNSFNKAGTLKCYYLIDGYYVDLVMFDYP